MREKYIQSCTYSGSFLGAAGGLILAFVLGPIKEGNQPNAECVQSAKEMGVDFAAAIQQCAEYFVVMKYPRLNTIGLILIFLGFFIQFLPAIPKLWRWLRHVSAPMKPRKAAVKVT